MGQLDNFVATHMSERLFQPNRLVMTLSSLAMRSLSAQAGKSSSEHVKRAEREGLLTDPAKIGR